MNTEITSNQDYINNELKKFNINDMAIAELKEKYGTLKINGQEDKEGYQMVRAARINVRDHRVDIDKKRKELNENAIAFQRAVNGEAKRLTIQLEPLENYLGEQESEYEAEKERIKLQKEAAEKARIQERINRLSQIGITFNGLNYVCLLEEFNRVPEWVKHSTDPEFEDFLTRACAALEVERERLAEIGRQEHLAAEEAERIKREEIERADREHKAELARLAELRKEEEAKIEKLRQEEEARRAEARKEEEARLEKIREQQAEEQRRLEIAAHEQAKKAAAEQARLAEIAKAQAAEQARIDADKKALAEAEAKAAAEWEEKTRAVEKLTFEQKYLALLQRIKSMHPELYDKLTHGIED